MPSYQAVIDWLKDEQESARTGGEQYPEMTIEGLIKRFEERF